MGATVRRGIGVAALAVGLAACHGLEEAPEDVGDESDVSPEDEAPRRGPRLDEGSRAAEAAAFGDARPTPQTDAAGGEGGPDGGTDGGTDGTEEGGPDGGGDLDASDGTTPSPPTWALTMGELALFDAMFPDVDGSLEVVGEPGEVRSNGRARTHLDLTSSGCARAAATRSRRTSRFGSTPGAWCTRRPRSSWSPRLPPAGPSCPIAE